MLNNAYPNIKKVVIAEIVLGKELMEQNKNNFASHLIPKSRGVGFQGTFPKLFQMEAKNYGHDHLNLPVTFEPKLDLEGRQISWHKCVVDKRSNKQKN